MRAQKIAFRAIMFALAFIFISIASELLDLYDIRLRDQLFVTSAFFGAFLFADMFIRGKVN